MTALWIVDESDQVERVKCPVCGFMALRSSKNGDLFSHFRGGDRSKGVCPESESFKRKPWER